MEPVEILGIIITEVVGWTLIYLVCRYVFNRGKPL